MNDNKHPTAVQDNMSALKQAFGRRLDKLRMAKGWRQSELARRAGLSRDQISTYIRGTSLPSRDSLEKLAQVFNCSPDDLWPTGDTGVNDKAFEMSQSPGFPGYAWVKVNQRVKASTALAIAKLLQDDADAASN